MLNCQICDIQVRGTNDLLRHGKIFHIGHNVKASNNIGEEIKVVKIPIKDMPIKKKGQKIADIVKKYLKNIEWNTIYSVKLHGDYIPNPRELLLSSNYKYIYEKRYYRFGNLAIPDDSMICKKCIFCSVHITKEGT